MLPSAVPPSHLPHPPPPPPISNENFKTFNQHMSSDQECHCGSHQIDYFEHLASLQEATCTCGSADCGPTSQQQQQQSSFISSTLPKPLKGILKNSSNMIGSLSANGSFHGMSQTLPRDFDVLPFDTMPPCDDCLQKARYQV